MTTIPSGIKIETVDDWTLMHDEDEEKAGNPPYVWQHSGGTMSVWFDTLEEAVDCRDKLVECMEVV